MDVWYLELLRVLMIRDLTRAGWDEGYAVTTEEKQVLEGMESESEVSSVFARTSYFYYFKERLVLTELSSRMSGQTLVRLGRGA